jgi:Flp pilus assembly protein TadG
MKIDKKKFMKRIQTEKGQAMVEMAIAMIVLLAILGGVLDFGRMYFTFLALQDAAGEGATYAAIHPTWHDDTGPNPNPDPNNITYRVQNESNSTLIDWSETNVIIEVPNVIAGTPLTVTVEYTYTVMTPMVQVITGDTIVLRGVSAHLIFLEESP